MTRYGCDNILIMTSDIGDTKGLIELSISGGGVRELGS